MLTAVHLANSIQREMPARISIRDVFGHSTARQLPDRRGQMMFALPTYLYGDIEPQFLTILHMPATASRTMAFLRDFCAASSALCAS